MFIIMYEMVYLKIHSCFFRKRLFEDPCFQKVWKGVLLWYQWTCLLLCKMYLYSPSQMCSIAWDTRPMCS